MSKSATEELFPTILRELDLAPGVHPHGTGWLSATSGLACVGHHAYVIADDEHHLGHFSLDHVQPVSLLRLFNGKLPRDKGKRKKAKPDLESLALLPAMELYPHGALLAPGSGSRATRNRATLLALDAAGRVQSPALQIDLTPLYVALQAHFAELNIEGTFVAEKELHLLQRGNKRGPNARISFALDSFVAWLLDDNELVPRATHVKLLDLGRVDGVPLTPTDATALADGKWLFCAVAEDTGDSYADGACLSSLIGIADAHGRIERMQHLHGNPKVEGIALEPGADPAGAELNILLVTDADNPLLASRLLRCTLRR